jgi:hypothetical protein
MALGVDILEGGEGRFRCWQGPLNHATASHHFPEIPCQNLKFASLDIFSTNISMIQINIYG